MFERDNPMFTLEAARRVARRGAVALPAAALALGTATAGLFSYRADDDLAAAMLLGQALWAAVLPAMVGAVTAHSVAREWRHDAMQALQLTDLTAPEILRGKFQAAALPALRSLLLLAAVNTFAVLVSAVTGVAIAVLPGLLSVCGLGLLGLAGCYAAGAAGALAGVAWRFTPGATGVGAFSGVMAAALWVWAAAFIQEWDQAALVAALPIGLMLASTPVCYALATQRLSRALAGA